jgi:hypothetical protein
MGHVAFVLHRPWSNYLSIEGGPWVRTIISRAPAYQRKMPGCEAYGPAPVRQSAKTRIVPDGLIFEILITTEGQGLIANKGAPRLAPPPIGRWHIARYGGLRDREAEH